MGGSEWHAPGNKQPGPGTYEHTAKPSRRRRVKYNSVFASTTNRFVKSAPGTLGAPAPGDYEVQPKWIGDVPAKLTLLDKPVFISNANRFGIKEVAPGVKQTETQGPGAYLNQTEPEKAMDPRRQGIAALEGRRTTNREQRWQADHKVLPTAYTPGPGSYKQAFP